MSVLVVKDLKKSYRKGFIPQTQEVLKGVSFTIEPSTITGFLGANGAGKTTTMKCVLGLAFPDSGEVTFFNGRPLDSEVRRRIGFLPEHPYFYDYLTGVEFLRFYGEISCSLSRKALNDRIDQLLKRVDLYKAKDKQLREYSKGMLQKIGMAQALIHEPEFVILDEPMSGLDPDGRMALNEIIREIARSGTAILLSSHLLNDAEKNCDYVVILKNGVVAYDGPTRNLLQKVGYGVEVRYFLNDKLHTEELPSLQEVQTRIDQLRKQGATISEIQQKRMSLEDAFVSIALREKES